jgi:hypothetical protein
LAGNFSGSLIDVDLSDVAPAFDAIAVECELTDGRTPSEPLVEAELAAVRMAAGKSLLIRAEFFPELGAVCETHSAWPKNPSDTHAANARAPPAQPSLTEGQGKNFQRGRLMDAWMFAQAAGGGRSGGTDEASVTNPSSNSRTVWRNAASSASCASKRRRAEGVSWPSK